VHNPSTVELLKDIKLPNINIVHLQDSELEETITSIEQVFFHDEINPKWFDLYSIARHFLVHRFIDRVEYSEPNLAICDSDMAILSSLNAYHKPTDLTLDTYAKSSLNSNFSIWKTESLGKFANITTIEKYFQMSMDTKLRCSDMHYYQWCIKNGILTFAMFNLDSYVMLDPFREFLYYMKIWKLVNPLTSEKDIIEWQDLGSEKWKSSSLVQVFNRCWPLFMTKIYSQGAAPTGYPLKCLTKATLSLKSILNNLDANDLSNNLIKSFSPKLDKIFDRGEEPELSILNIHFQGPSKPLASSLYDYMSSSLNCN
jgi:hypothetical protein